MSEHLEHEHDEEYDVVNFEDYVDEDEEEYEDDDYEEIDPAEIDAVVSVLNNLMDQVKSQTIKDYLEATCSDIACLMEELEDDQAQSEAA